MKDLTPEEQFLIQTFNCLSSDAQRIILIVLRLIYKAEVARNDLSRN